MLNNGAHEQLRNAATAMLRDDEHIRDMSDSGKVRNHSGKANLSPIQKRAKAKRMLDRPLDNLSRYALRPVGRAQKIVNQRNIQATAVSGNLIVPRSMHKGGLRSLTSGQPSQHRFSLSALLRTAE